MAPSVLGKRARAGSTESPKSTKGTFHQRLDCHCLSLTTILSESSSISSRVKRRATLSIINDENADPNAAQNEHRSTLYDDGMLLGALEDSFSLSQRAEIVAKPRHCTPRKEWVALFPDQISSHFKITKAISSMFFEIGWNDPSKKL